MYKNNPPTPSWSPPPIQAPVPQHPQRPGANMPEFATNSQASSHAGSPAPVRPGMAYNMSGGPYGGGATGSFGGPAMASSSNVAAPGPAIAFSQQPHQRHPQQPARPPQQAFGSQAYTPTPASVQSKSYYGNAPAGPFNQFQPQQQQPSQQPYAPYPAQQSQAPQPQEQGYFGTTFINEFQSTAAGQLGMQLGRSTFQQVQAGVNQNINRWINVPHLKYYFNVSNSYVLTKLRLLLFPFRHQSWTRLVRRSEQNGQMEGYKPPREDLNAPDLYIPVMSFVTYILLVGVRMGLAGANKGSEPGSTSPKSFSPDVLGLTGTTASVIILLQLMVLKVGFYLFGVSTEAVSVGLLDLLAYCGYGFIGVNATSVVKIFSSDSFWAVYGMFSYTMICLAFFTLRTLRYVILPEGYNPIDASTRQRRIQFLFFVVLVQILSAWLLV
ncbi:YIF1-domain-containing protein [Gaertneriomyces semiglobifer]|nr:YIF1-domain-containing protein [Gaertneriomyces semiglobifer]